MLSDLYSFRVNVQMDNQQCIFPLICNACSAENWRVSLHSLEFDLPRCCVVSTSQSQLRLSIFQLWSEIRWTLQLSTIENILAIKINPDCTVSGNKSCPSMLGRGEYESLISTLNYWRLTEIMRPRTTPRPCESHRISLNRPVKQKRQCTRTLFDFFPISSTAP
jgi:hypothetical protein